MPFAALGWDQHQPFGGCFNNAKQTLLLAFENTDDTCLVIRRSSPVKAGQDCLANSGRTPCLAA